MPQPPKSGAAPGLHPRGLAHNLASITSRIIVAQAGDTVPVGRRTRHRWWLCVIRSDARPFGQRCPSCCTCTTWGCDCPEHATFELVEVGAR